MSTMTIHEVRLSPTRVARPAARRVARRVERPSTVRLTRRGRLLSNELFARLLPA